MCVTPNTIHYYQGPNLVRTKVPCGKCWACRHNKINDLVGRGMCEGSTSDWMFFLNLTYDDRKVISHTQTQFITKVDFQHFMMRFRILHKKTRYIVAGEYGGEKGRAHFHVILFGQGMPPSIPQNQRTHIKEWPWGHVYGEQVTGEKSIRYVAKYLQKKNNPKVKRNAHHHEEWVSYSKKPLLGYEFIIKKAERQAAMRVFPTTFNYTPPGASDGYRYSFYGKAQEVYFDKLFELWPEAIYNSHKTEWMENAFRRYVKTKWRRRYERMCKTAKILEHEKMLQAALTKNSQTVKRRELNQNRRSKWHDEQRREAPAGLPAERQLRATRNPAARQTRSARERRDQLIAKLAVDVLKLSPPQKRIIDKPPVARK